MLEKNRREEKRSTLLQSIQDLFGGVPSAFVQGWNKFDLFCKQKSSEPRERLKEKRCNLSLSFRTKILVMPGLLFRSFNFGKNLFVKSIVFAIPESEKQPHLS